MTASLFLRVSRITGPSSRLPTHSALLCIARCRVWLLLRFQMHAFY